MAFTVDYVSNWATRLRSRLYTQFRNKVTWGILVDYVLAPQMQDIEDAAQSLFTLMDIDASEGVQLDLIGKDLGQPRGGVGDVVYRLYLKARVLANKSEGTPEQIYRVFRALYGTSIGLIITASDLKSFALRVKGAITAAQALVGLDFLGDSKEAGARAVLQWQEYPDAEMFCFSGGSGLGFGSATDSSVGGRFARAIEA